MRWRVQGDVIIYVPRELFCPETIKENNNNILLHCFASSQRVFHCLASYGVVSVAVLLHCCSAALLHYSTAAVMGPHAAAHASPTWRVLPFILVSSLAVGVSQYNNYYFSRNKILSWLFSVNGKVYIYHSNQFLRVISLDRVS